VTGIQEEEGGEGEAAVMQASDAGSDCQVWLPPLLASIRCSSTHRKIYSPALFYCFSTFLAFLFSNPPIPRLASGEVIDGNSGALAKGNSSVPLYSLSFFFLLLF